MKEDLCQNTRERGKNTRIIKYETELLVTLESLKKIKLI